MIIVTGGAGFIGSAIIAGLNARGISDILVVDQLGSDQRWKNLRNLSFVDYIEKDDFLQMVLAKKIQPTSRRSFIWGPVQTRLRQMPRTYKK